MANQMIALQARNPQLPDPARITAQYANMMNMARQQEAAQRQAQQAQQTMDINAAQEARAARLAEPQFAKAQSEATAADLKTKLEFQAFVYTALKNADNPDQVVGFAERIAGIPQFQDPMFQGALSDAVASMPIDPVQFGEWRKATAAKTLTGAQQLEQEYIKQTTGTEERLISVPKFGGAGATEVPGSRIKVAEGMTYVKGADDATYAMPTKSGGSFGTPAPSMGATAGQYGAAIENAVMQLAPGTIVSGRGRTQARNAEVGGVSNSYHLSDNARDLQPAKGQTLDQLAASLAPLKQQGFDVVIERRKNHVHVEPGAGMARGSATPSGLTPVLPGKPTTPKAAAPKAAATTPEAKLARDTAVQDLYNAIVDAQKKGHLTSEKQSYVANRAQETLRGRTYLPGGTAQKTSLDDIDTAATQLLRLFIQKGTSGTLNTKAEQDNFMRSVGGADASYETRLKTIRNFAKQNGIPIKDTAAAKPKAEAPKTSTSKMSAETRAKYGL
jgi:hypothetical protein